MDRAGYGMIGAVAKGSMLTLALFFLFSSIPLLGGVTGLFVPLPCVYYSLKNSRVTGYAIVLLVILFLTFLDRSGLLQYLLFSVICSIFLPEFLARGKRGAGSLFLTVGLNALLVAAFAVIVVLLLGIDIDAQMRKIIHDTLSQIGDTYRQTGVSGQELQGLEEGLRVTEKFFVRIYPSFVLVFLGAMVGANLLVLQRLAVSFSGDIEFGSFSEYRNPYSLVWLLILSGFTLLADNHLTTTIALNVLLVLYFLYFVQGLAVFVWFAKKKNFPLIVRVVFYSLLALQPLLSVAVAVFGLADLWADFRAYKKNKNL